MQQLRLYERVSGKLEEAMRVGALRPGDRLPSVRGLSERERVSVSTVLQAYLQLEARGLIEARPQSGHYVRRQRPLPPEPPPTRPAPGATPVTISALVAKVVESARDPDLVPLGCNQPDPELFPWGRLGRIAAGIARDGGGVTYELPPGARSLRRQLARRSAEWGCALPPAAPRCEVLRSARPGAPLRQLLQDAGARLAHRMGRGGKVPRARLALEVRADHRHGVSAAACDGRVSRRRSLRTAPALAAQVGRGDDAQPGRLRGRPLPCGHARHPSRGRRRDVGRAARRNLRTEAA